MKYLILLLCLALPIASEAANLVAIVVANSFPREDNVGREYDVLKMVEELETISINTGLDLDLTLCMDEEYNHEILTKLQDLPVNPTDVLFFLYRSRLSL